MFSNMLIAVLIAIVTTSTSAQYFHPKTLSQIRSANFQSSDFVIDLNKANVQAVTDGRLLQFGDLSSFKVLGLDDVGVAFARVTLENGVENPTHVHPRGTEALYLIKGTLDVFIAGELGNTARYENTIYAGQGSVFPQGLAHGQKCIDKDGCEFVAVLNSADPGSFSVSV